MGCSMLNPCRPEFISGNIKIDLLSTYVAEILPRGKTRIFCLVDIMVADEMATQGLQAFKPWHWPSMPINSLSPSDVYMSQ